ncbi:MAG: metallophosphoesterase family protein [Gammaproteobacteria bacterium]|nr:metallophosphoesterase family protein [Gammaproteobacteria bacterium]
MLLNKETDFSQAENIKIGILSDTHNELSESVSAIIKDCDIAIHAGDIGCSAVLEALQPKSGHVIAVAGNNDKPYLWDVKDWAVVKTLPDMQTLTLPSGTIVIEHGHEHDSYKPPHSDLRKAHPEARLVIYGHTHIHIIDKEDASTDVINPGAAGFTRNKGGASCIVLTINNNVWDYKVYKFSD